MVPTSTWHITSFYRFIAFSEDQISAMRDSVDSYMTANDMLGLVLLAPEGVNATVAGSNTSIVGFKHLIEALTGLTDIRYKDSTSGVRPFHRKSVNVRTEIVGLKRPDLVPEATDNHHLSPRQWHEMLSADAPKVVVDTRNQYETMLGTFRGAVDPALNHFSDWGAYLDSAGLPTDVPVMIYCTGGIRCEKAILEMKARGFDEVYQLRDGILGYLAEYPEGHFEGDCFVFDDRVALGPDLQPSGRFGICPACGLTSGVKESLHTLPSGILRLSNLRTHLGPRMQQNLSRSIQSPRPSIGARRDRERVASAYDGKRVCFS